MVIVERRGAGDRNELEWALNAAEVDKRVVGGAAVSEPPGPHKGDWKRDEEDEFDGAPYI